MSVIDIDSLLVEFSAESPCGEDLTYDPAYLELETMVRGTAAGGGMIETGDDVAEEPNWTLVQDRCIELLGRTKDLRVIIYLTLALLKTDSFEGLHDGLHLMHGILERYWDIFYPQLDPEDNNDPLERMNIISSLSPAAGSYQDALRFKQRALEAPMCRSARMGTFCYRDILIATGALSEAGGDDTSPPDMAVIEAAFDDTDSNELQNTSQAVTASVETVNSIEQLLNNLVGIGAAPNLDGFAGTLKDIQKHLQGYLAKRGYAAAPEADADADADTAAASVGTQKPDEVKPISGEIRSPQDVSLAIDKICKYYERQEPSSPIPLLLRRAQRLVSKNFIDIIRDVAPDAMGKIEGITGLDSGDSQG
ncbi:MAG: type VI secretion system protein TssA [Sedimentisphaerales bacterium]|nr:type VI secretion system protein TssA [Sedimentisphaerales bacterium]